MLYDFTILDGCDLDIEMWRGASVVFDWLLSIVSTKHFEDLQYLSLFVRAILFI